MAELSQRMRALSAYASRRGLEFLMFENMSGPLEFGHVISEARVLDEIGNAATPWVLCLDVGHIAVLPHDLPDAAPSAWISERWSHPPMLQLQQASRGADHHWPFTSEHNREGGVDGAEVVKALREQPTLTDVVMFLEVMHPPETANQVVLRELQESVEYWVSKGAIV